MTKKIKVTKDGPYEVSGGVPLDQQAFVPNARGFSLEYEKQTDYPPQETYHLCRCGESEHKPFCDGSHAKTAFNGKECAGHKTYDQMAETIKGIQLDLMDAPELCAGARFCDTKSGTWNLVQTGHNPEAKEIAIQQCADCPSGRLTAVTKEGERLEPALPQEISVLEDPAAECHGPLWVKGGIEIEDENGQKYPERNRVTLCRCGKSNNKPFCDGSHLQ